MKTVVLKDRFVNNRFYCFYIFFNSILCFLLYCVFCMYLFQARILFQCVIFTSPRYCMAFQALLHCLTWDYLWNQFVSFFMVLSVMLYYYYAVFKMFYALSDHVFNASVSWLNFSIVLLLWWLTNHGLVFFPSCPAGGWNVQTLQWNLSITWNTPKSGCFMHLP